MFWWVSAHNKKDFIFLFSYRNLNLTGYKASITVKDEATFRMEMNADVGVFRFNYRTPPSLVLNGIETRVASYRWALQNVMRDLVRPCCVHYNSVYTYTEVKFSTLLLTLHLNTAYILLKTTIEAGLFYSSSVENNDLDRHQTCTKNYYGILNFSADYY